MEYENEMGDWPKSVGKVGKIECDKAQPKALDSEMGVVVNEGGTAQLKSAELRQELEC